MAGKFSWDDLPDAKTAPVAGPSANKGSAKAAKFDWDSMPDHQAEPPGAFDGTTKNMIDSLPMIGGVVGGILGTPADAVVGPVGNMVGAGIGGYVGTAAKNLINKYYDQASAPKSMTDVMTQPLVGGAEQGLMQGVGEATAPFIQKGLQAGADVIKSGSKWIGAKLLSNLGGVRPEVIKEYSQFSKRINAAPSVDALKEVSDDVVGKLASDLDTKKLSLDQAHEAFKGLQSDLKDAYRSSGYDARDAVNSAQQSLKDAHNTRIQNLSSDIYDTVNKLKSDVKEGSGKALETLNKSDAHVNLDPVYSQIDSTVDRLGKAGTDEAEAVAAKLNDYKSRLLEKHGTTIPAPDAKKLIQGLDQITEYSPMAGSFDKAKNSAFKDIRSSLDSTLKGSVPEYAKAMEPVAADADLLNRVSDFGDKQSAAGLLGRINAPNQMERRAALQELGQKYGPDFVSAASPHNLPEQQLLNRAQSSQEALRPDRVAEKIDQTLASSRQKSALEAAQSGYLAAQEKLAPFKSLAPNVAGQTTAQQKLLQLSKGKNIELEEMFSKLGKLSNTDFIQAMKDNQIKSAFEKGATNGSRNTLMGAIAGFTFAGVPGLAGGGSAGRVIDQWGPAITKKILDGVIKVASNPTAETISRLDLPQPIKKNMLIGLQNYLLKGQQLAEQSLPNVADSSQKELNRSPAKGPDAWALNGVQNLGIQDKDLMNRLLQSPKGKELLIQASDMAPGSKAMKQITNKIQKGWGSR